MKDLFRKISSNGKTLLFFQQTNILSAATVIAAAVLVSRFLGIVRYWLLAIYIKPISDLDLFFAAFRLPDLLFQILVMGTLTTAFIPVITGYLSSGEDRKAWRSCSIIINLALLIFALLALLAFIFTPQLALVVAPGFTGNPAKTQTLINLTRIMLSAQVFFIISNFFSAIIQSTKRFLIPALAPVAYNLGIIIGIVFLSGNFGVYGPAWGVVLGTILHLVIQIPLVSHLKFHYETVVDLKNEGVREIGKLLGPRTLGLAIAQLSFTVDTALASLLPASSITILNLAQALQQFPIGVFGATIAQAALPTLAEDREKGNLENFKSTLLTSLHQILFLTMPAAVILIVLRIPMVRLAFGLGNTNIPWPLTVLTGKTLAVFAVAVAAQSLLNLLVRGFYALRDSSTPVKIGIFAFTASIAFSLTFITVLHWPVWSLALSSTLGDLINFSLLLFFLDRKLNFDKKNLLLPAVKIILAALATGISLYVPMKLLDQLVFDTTKTVPLIMLVGTVSLIGLSVYLFFTWLLDIQELKAFLGLIQKVGQIKKVFTPPAEVIEVSPETYA